jgi:predicted Zn-dependent peptidase
MTSTLKLAVVIVVIALAAGCRKTATSGAELLPGRTRPILEHGWTHPRDLRFSANSFQPPDAKSALVTTGAGLRAFVIPAEGDPVVQIVAAIPLGPAREQADEAGVADLMSRLLQQDIGGRLGPDFVGRLQVDQDLDVTRVSVQTFSTDVRLALTAVVGALRDARFDPSAIASYRTSSGYTRPTRNLGGAGFRPAVELARLSAGRPIAPPDAGVPVRREAVAAMTSRALGPQSVVLGIGGGVARSEIEAALNELGAGWVGPAETSNTAPAPSEAKGDRFLAIDEPGFTTWLAVGHPMPALEPSDEAPLAVMAQILNIRLNIVIREIRGLANQAVLNMPATTRSPGLLHVRSGARPESIAPIAKYAKEELTRIREQAGMPTVDELEQAKGGIVLSQWQRSLDGARAASATFATETVQNGSLDRLHRWPDTVRGVTAEQVQAAAAKYIQPDKLATVLIGQLDAVRTARHPRWPATLDELSKSSAGGTRSQSNR